MGLLEHPVFISKSICYKNVSTVIKGLLYCIKLLGGSHLLATDAAN